MNDFSTAFNFDPNYRRLDLSAVNVNSAPQVRSSVFSSVFSLTDGIKNQIESNYTPEFLQSYEREQLSYGTTRKLLSYYDYKLSNFLGRIGLNIANENGFSGLRLDTREDYQKLVGRGFLIGATVATGA